MKVSFIFIIFLFTIYEVPHPVNSQTDSCSSILNLNGLVSFDTTTLDCLLVWTSQNFVLRYMQNATNLWTFVLSAPVSNSYIAIGFSTNGLMVGSSAIVGWISSDGTGTVNQYYLGGQTPSQVLLDQGNLQISGNSSSILSQSSRLYLAFQLIIDQPPSHLLYAVGPTGVLPSAPAYLLSEHRDEVSTTINYVAGQSSSGTPQATLKRSHGVLNMLGWGILIIIGAIVARYFKEWDPVWFYSHTLIQSCGFILGVAGISCGFVLENRLQVDVSSHKILGILVLVLGCLQVMAFLARPDKSSKVRKYWNWYHYGVGRILMVIAISNVFYGIHLGEKGNGRTSWNAGYGVVLAIMCLVAVVLEFRMRMRN
ncbi:Cytochrom_B561 domain-containing protein/DOMON domain-containing protein [Cephalotus follicularis]|uniref:Cytochrom_B561 domain-containing protein/DOMON domain-containing protein n=1 Tax=Cephalotus follicularis TaxID=3775 RepID=A0A1Q3BK45_CEPFO|nr:Cytochrom_B561 domain-containing protein/DOMON domain-containing protein [Cephalotus follicularis]